jgi:uncharacterized membrane protein YcgQ (UPF0703/DUF1980 family)
MNTLLEYLSPKIAEAAAVSPIANFVGKVNRYITNPLIVLMFAAALVYFLYGVVQFITNADKPDEREIGQSHMLWGVIGMFIMFAVFAIIRILENTLGVKHNPNVPSY